MTKTKGIKNDIDLFDLNQYDTIYFKFMMSSFLDRCLNENIKILNSNNMMIHLNLFISNIFDTLDINNVINIILNKIKNNPNDPDIHILNNLLFIFCKESKLKDKAWRSDLNITIDDHLYLIRLLYVISSIKKLDIDMIYSISDVFFEKTHFLATLNNEGFIRKSIKNYLLKPEDFKGEIVEIMKTPLLIHFFDTEKSNMSLNIFEIDFKKQYDIYMNNNKKNILNISDIESNFNNNNNNNILNILDIEQKILNNNSNNLNNSNNQSNKLDIDFSNFIEYSNFIRNIPQNNIDDNNSNNTDNIDNSDNENNSDNSDNEDELDRLYKSFIKFEEKINKNTFSEFIQESNNKLNDERIYLYYLKELKKTKREYIDGLIFLKINFSFDTYLYTFNKNILKSNYIMKIRHLINNIILNF